MTPSRTLALLGPTNTGKTHHAVERMLTHLTGMMGLPLRLLAREIYDRVTARLGEAAVALVTGEEKRIPPRPRYWICTVEAMPLDRTVDFVAIDEVQLGAHRERGHVFTDRLLSARGRVETWFLGADTVRPLVRELIPGVEIESRPRLSTLRSAGRIGLRDLPPRSAIVAFSAQRVYELAERMRARRGGAAVVLGALSPRARNAQVALYQSGEVDTLVATDAIGMGLNLDVDLVAFADLAKFDGRQVRPLDEAELAQIAGRAGRFRHDGTFAVLDPLGPLPPSVIRALETHRFPPLAQLYWRNGALDFSSAGALLAALRAKSPHPALRLAPLDEDERAFVYLSEHPDTAPLLAGATGEVLRMAWDVCQIPDYRQLALDEHFRLQATIFTQLARAGRLDEAWLRERIEPLDQEGGDVETLTAHLASIRTWTYVAHRADWVAEAVKWQERARAIEDRLSDGLHAELVRRFVDSAGRKGRRRARASAEVVEGHAQRGGAAARNGVLAARLRAALGPAAFSDAPDRARGERPSAAATERGVSDAYVESIVDAPHEGFALEDDGRIRFRGGAVLARLARGPDLLRPEVALLIGEPQVGAGARLRLMRRLLAFARDVPAHLLADIGEVPAAASPRVRGLVYQLEQGLGTVLAGDARAQLRELEQEDRDALSALGVVQGELTVFVPALLKDDRLRARAILVRAHFGAEASPPLPHPGELFWMADANVPPRAYVAAGFPLVGEFAVRADVLESVVRRYRAGASPKDLARRMRANPEEGLAVRRAIDRVLHGS